MKDKTPMYMLIIVGIVALVGIIVLLSSGSGQSEASDSVGGAIIGNVAGYSDNAASGDFAKVLFTLFLLGVAGFMYYRSD